MNEIAGSCLCGQVSYAIQPPFAAFQYCFCSRCRKVSGSAHGSNIIVPPEQFRWLRGEDLVGRYEIPQARHFASCFCTHCGSSLPWFAKSGSAVIIPSGTLDQDPGATPQQNIFWDSHPSWYRLPTALKTYSTLPGKSEPCKLDPEDI